MSGNVIQRIPRIRLLRGERQREFILGHDRKLYISPPLDNRSVISRCSSSIPGLRLGEALSLEWPQIHLEPANGAKFGYLTVLSGKAKGKESSQRATQPSGAVGLENLGPRESGRVFQRVNGGSYRRRFSTSSMHDCVSC